MSHNIRIANFSHLQQIVDLHADVLSYSITSKLGKSILLELYSAMLNNPSIFYGLICERDGAVDGFTFATVDINKSRNIITSIYRKYRLELFLYLCMHPKDFLIILESYFLIPKLIRAENIEAELLTVVVDKNKVGVTTVFELFKKIFTELKKQNISLVAGQFYADKDRLESFYKLLGAKVIRKTKNNILIKFPIGSIINNA